MTGSIATSYLGISHGAASQAAHEATTGNISMGNSNIGNHSYNNTSANKMSTSGTMDTGTMKSVGSSGMMATNFRDGSSTFDNSAAISNTGDTKMNLSESTANRLSQEAGHQEQLGKQDSIASSKHMSTALEKSGQLMHTMAQHQASGVDYRQGLTSDQNKAIETFNMHSQKFAQQEGISTSLAAKVLASASAGGSWLGLKGSLEGSGEFASRSSFEHAQDYQKQHNLKDSLSTGLSLAENKNLNISDSNGHSLTDGISTNLREARSLDESSNMHHSNSASLNESASKVKENTSSINRDQGQKYKEWLEKQHYPGSASPYPMGTAGASEVWAAKTPTKREINESMQQKFMDEQSGEIAKQYYPGNNSNLGQQFNDNSAQIRGSKQPEINNSFNDRKVKIEEMNNTISRPDINNDKLKYDVPMKIEENKYAIKSNVNNGQQIVENVHNKLNDNYLQKLKKFSINPENDDK